LKNSTCKKQGAVEGNQTAAAGDLSYLKSPSVNQSVPEVFTLQPALASFVESSDRLSGELER